MYAPKTLAIVPRIIGLIGLAIVLPMVATVDAQDEAAAVRLHYRPADGFFGDAFPFYHQGVYHLFHLTRRESDAAATVGVSHIASRDLVHWWTYPDPLPHEALTGSVLEKDGIFHMFYTRNGISHATSQDLVHWTVDPKSPIVTPDERWYDPRAWRDPCVIWNPTAKCYWMIMCGHANDEGKTPLTGCLALATSPDLEQWTVEPPVWTPGFTPAVECPDLFPFKDKWAIVHFWHQTCARVADSPNGPWRRPKIDSPDSFDLFAGKTMFDGNRRILVGWLPRRKCDCGERIWGGNMLFPREWYLLPDGTPATRCVPEVLAAYANDPTAGRGARVFVPTRSSWDVEPTAMKTSPSAGQSSLAVWKESPADYCLSTRIRFEAGGSVVLLLRGQEGAYHTALDTAYALHLDPVQHRVALHKQYEWNQRPALVDMPYDFQTSAPTLVEVFVDKDILEVFLDHRQSLVSRLLENPQGSLSVLVRDAPAAFEDLQLRVVPANAAK